MAVRTSFTAGEVLAAADLTDTFGAKLNLAGGKVLQVVRATDGTLRTTTSGSFVDASISVTITPQKLTSAVLLFASVYARTSRASGNNIDGQFQITDSSNNAISGAEGMGMGIFNISARPEGGATHDHVVSLFGYATPSTTSAATFKLRFRTPSTVTLSLENASNTAQLYAIEVSA